MPVIVSASRSTDIPAFHHRWFASRLDKGFVKWINPFNGNPLYVSFQNTRVIVFWTKNPENFISGLKKIDEKNINYYFQFTLNDYDDEGFEPNVPPLRKRIETFKRLSGKLGPKRVIWRFDPLLPTDETPPAKLIEKIRNIGRQLSGHTEKLVFSFADIELYRKVKINMQRYKIPYGNFEPEDIEFMASELRSTGRELNIEISACAERHDLSKYGISRNRCVDGGLMSRIFSGDEKLMRFLGYSENGWKSLKDKGQRKYCGCIVSKDIGRYNTCRHLCRYCYANSSEETVMKNFRL